MKRTIFPYDFAPYYPVGVQPCPMYVDVNEGLLDFVYNKDKANDYFKLKHVLIWLRRSYLLCSPLSEDRYYELYDTYEEKFKKSEAAYYVETTFSMTTEIGPMALVPHLWLADMYYYHGMHDEADKLHSLRYCQQDCFLVKEANAEYVTLKDSKGDERKLKNVYSDLFRTDAYICTALVKYGDNDWEVNGVLFKSNRDVYDKMCERNKQLEVSYESVYPLYMERTKAKRMAFFENKSELKKWLRKVAPEIDIDEMEHQLPSGSQVAFISKKAGIIFAPNMIYAIKCKDNPYYKKCDARKLQTETMDAVFNTEAMHPEMLNYLLENKMLEDGDLSCMMPSELGNHIFTMNIDFIARNHRRHYYHDHDY